MNFFPSLVRSRVAPMWSLLPSESVDGRAGLRRLTRMKCPRRPFRLIPLLLAALVSACSGDRAPRNDTTTPEGSPPEEPSPAAPSSTWNRSAGALFAVKSSNGNNAWLVNPLYGDTQVLDTLTSANWNVEGLTLTMIDGATIAGTGRITALKYDSLCAGWPTAGLQGDAPATTSWRLAFPEGTVEGIAFDSLHVLPAADSAARARDGALAASRLPDDTAAAFRGRPFNVRQASRFQVAPDTIFTLYEVVRLVAQEANPLQEQILIVTEEGPGREAVVTYHRREIGAEESMGSIELLGVLRVRATGRLAIVIRRERESGFVLEWIERSARGTWNIRWRSATDSC
jgi:hypothetical protein